MRPGSVLLQINDGAIRAHYTVRGVDYATRVNSKKEFVDLLIEIGHDGRGVLISSTLHHPEEYTDDPRVIALAEELSGEQEDA